MFFDHLDEPYEYEPQGLKVGDTCYLPDFYLPRSKAFLEVKGCVDQSLAKPLKLGQAIRPTGVAVYVLIGGFPIQRQLARHGWWNRQRREGVASVGPAFDWEMWFPLSSPAVLEACEKARSARFESPPRRQAS